MSESWPSEDIEIVAPMAEWPRIRGDERFVELMRLARATNGLSIAYAPLAHTLDDQSPAARRHRFAAFVYVAAVLKEALDTAQSLGKWFRQLPQYHEGFGAIFKDPDVRKLRETNLDALRDKFVFHFDREAMAQSFHAFPTHGDVRILSYPLSGPTFGDTYFDAADDAPLAHLFGDSQTDDEYFTRIKVFMDSVSELLFRFMPASHRLIAMGLLQLGCVKKPMQRQAGISDEAI
jgi:hypothetical protein